MIRKFIDLGVGKQFVMRVHNFLNDRSPYVNVSGHCSPHVSISTGAHQRCCRIPCRSAHLNNHDLKYTDDTALVGLPSNDETDYRSDIDHFVSWCVANCFKLCVTKTKEIVIDFRSGVHHPDPVNIKW